MRKIILALAAIMTLSLVACAQNKGGKRMQTERKTLVVYFSATCISLLPAPRPTLPAQLRMSPVAHCMRLFPNKLTPPTTLTGTTSSRAAL